MDLHTSLWLFQATQAIGLALWLSIAVLNNLQAFASSMGAIGATLAMAPLRQPPAIEFPLLRRACQSAGLARAALLVILLLQIVASLAAWTGCYGLIVAQDPLLARAWLNLALSAFLACTFAMLLGGLWFAYWIRQEGLQLTHLILVLWAILAFFLFNLAWA